MLLIRNETAADIEAIRRINDLAFCQRNESALVEALRRRGAYTLSLVAELNGQLIGHVLFSPVTIDASDHQLPALGMGPMAVLPEHQKSGVGSALIRRGLELSRADGHRIVVVVGHPDFYPRFGFQVASRYGIRFSYEGPDEVFMAVELVPGALAESRGIVRYQPEFDLV